MSSDTPTGSALPLPPAGGAVRGVAIVLVAVFLSSFFTPFMLSALNVALPAIGADLGMDAVLLGWVATSYTLAAAVGLVPFGRLADIHGRRRVFVLGMVVSTLGMLLSSLAPDGRVLIAARVVNGVGAAMGFATGMAILTSLTPPASRGRVLGWNVAAVYLGLSLGPFLGGAITDALGWRWVFGLTSLISALTAAALLRSDGTDWAEARGERFDAVGTLLYGGALVAVMTGLPRVPSAAGLARLAVGGVLLAAFVAYERRAASPVLRLSIFAGNPVFTFSCLAALINYSATAAVTFLLSLYLQYAKGLSPRQAGTVLIAQPLVMALFSPAAGRLSDRVSPGLIASAGMALTAAGLAMLGYLRQDTPLVFVVGTLLVLGAGFGLFSSPNTNAVMGAVERRAYGLASGMLGTMRLLGQMLSMGIVMLILSLVLGRARITAETLPRFLLCARIAFGVFTGLCVLGIAASLVRTRAAARGAPPA